MSKRITICLLAVLVVCSGTWSIDFSPRAYECPTTHTVIASGFQRFARLKNSDGDATTRFNPSAGAVGYIYSPSSWYVGTAFSWEYGTRKYDVRHFDANAKIRSNIPGFSLYGGIEIPEGWYADAGTFMGWSEYRAKSANLNNLHFGSGDKEHETVFAANLELGKNFDPWEGFILTPHVGFDYAYTPGESYQWGGGGNPSIGVNSSQNYVEIPLGVSLSKAFDYGTWKIVPKVDVTMVNSLGNMDNMNTSPGFAYYTPKGWRVAGIGGDHIGARVSAGVKANMSERTSLGLDYTYEGRERYNDHRISAMFGLSF